MPKQNKRTTKSGGSTPPGTGRSTKTIVVAWVVMAGVVAAVFAVIAAQSKHPGAEARRENGKAIAATTNSASTNAPAVVATNAPATVATNAPGELPSMEVNRAVMVTEELDFGPKVPSIAEALTQIERQHQPADGVGRVFAILDAYGEPTPDGKKLHISMHLSTEKPGIGTLVFRPTGRVLWKNRIVASTNAAPFTGKNLTIMIDDGQGKTFLVDGSGGPMSILDCTLQNKTPLKDFWPDGAERELTFIYSACGCPVKVKVRRTGGRTARTKDLPVMFPDDPTVMIFISQLMGW